MEEELKAEIAGLKKEVARLEKVITLFKKYFDGWSRFKNQLGLQEERNKIL